MPPMKLSLIHRSLNSFVILSLSTALITFNFLRNTFVKDIPVKHKRDRFISLMNSFFACLKGLYYLIMLIFTMYVTKTYHLIKYLTRHIQLIFGITTGHHYSLVNIRDGDFEFGTTVDRLFNQNNNNKGYNNPDIHDVFHIFLCKLLYESSDRIIEQCIAWGFNEESIKTFSYVQSIGLKKYSYPIRAVVINHDESNTIIIAFQGRKPLDLLQWWATTPTNFIDIQNVFNKNNNDPIRVHAGFYFALGLNAFNPSQPIDFSQVNPESPMFIQLLNVIQKILENNKEYKISITGHGLGGALASLFSFILLCYGYESSICGVYTYGQPLVGNRFYAKILNNKLGYRVHRWVNHDDIVTRIPVIESSKIPWYYGREQYSDAFEVTENHVETTSYIFRKHYYHSGLRFKINRRGNLERQGAIDEGPIFAYQERFDSFQFIYSIENAIQSLFRTTLIETFLWLTLPVEINDHSPSDYASKITHIVRDNWNIVQ